MKTAIFKLLLSLILIKYTAARHLSIPGGYKHWARQDPGDYTSVYLQSFGRSFDDLEILFIEQQLFDREAVEKLILQLAGRATSLNKFSVGNNKICGTFDIGKLQVLRKLTDFWINDNQITDLVYTATENMPALKTISFDGNNITSVDFEIFSKLPNINTIYLINNQIAGTIDIGKLKTMKSLKLFYINGNQITEIINTANEEIPSVTELDFSSNLLSYMDLNILIKFVNLEELSLDANNLVKVEGFATALSILPKLTVITLNTNNFVCSDLEQMVAPYKQEFWDNQNREDSCSGPKSQMFRGVFCCYPTVEDQMKENPKPLSKFESERKSFLETLADITKKMENIEKDQIENEKKWNRILQKIEKNISN